jgi:homoserine dehydrogenase
MEQVKLVLIGVGNIGRRFLEILVRKEDALRARYGLGLVLVGAADTSGAALSAEGLDPLQVIQLKQKGQGVAAYPLFGKPGMEAVKLVREARGDVLLEASPTNLRDGQPGLGCMEEALRQGMHVVTSNKGPLVLAYPRLVELAAEKGVRLAFSGAVAGGLPTVNIGRRDLAGSDILRLEGILNLTTNYILTQMAEGDKTYTEALAEAQAAGHAEADPSLDVEGWDAANKLVILAQSVLGYPASLKDVEVKGITDIGPEELRQAAASGRVIKLIAKAERENGGYRLSVRPTWLDLSHPLARLTAHQMGIVYHTDINGTITATIVEEDPVPTAAAMLRDLINIYQPGDKSPGQAD